ncbi:signal peptide peptidase SppA [Bacteroidia bacterium]|nr:signal peptide peptidase SppA [Bacteroidia bacterium]
MLIAWSVVVIMSLVFMISMAASMGEATTTHVAQNSVLKINLNSVITDRKTDNPMDWLLRGGSSSIETVGLNELLKAIEKAKSNDHIKGIYLFAGQTMTGYASMEPIRKALLDFKKSGKFIIAYGENFNHRSYYASSVADSVFMNPQGTMDFRGLASSIQFNKAVLEKWGIEMQVYKVGTYKSAVEPYIQDKMSDANREQVTAFLNDIWGTLLAGISESRGISEKQLNQYADECMTFAAPEKLIEYRLIDGLRYSDEVQACLKAKAGIKVDDKLALVSVKEMKSLPNEKKTSEKEKIAVLYAEGEIVGDAVPSFYSSGIITAKEMVKELNRLKDNDDVKAVVFRVNSPGGSGYASEQIWHAVETLRAKKPVVVSMGDYAASGGYYIACGANKIVAEPSTLTGSIGVFGLIPNGAVLAKKMGATFDGVSTNKYSSFGSSMLSIPLLGIGLLPARPLNSEEGAMVQAHVERFYDTFLTRVSEGRHTTKEKIDAIGQGRVWTGQQALNLGLVDILGGVDVAIQTAAKLANVEKYAVSEYPAAKEFWMSLLNETTESVSDRIAKAFIGKEACDQKRLLKLWQSYDYRQAILPESVMQ